MTNGLGLNVSHHRRAVGGAHLRNLYCQSAASSVVWLPARMSPYLLRGLTRFDPGFTSAAYVLTASSLEGEEGSEAGAPSARREDSATS